MTYQPLYFPSNIDSTMLSSWSSCPQKFFQEFIIRKVPIGKSIHLHAGGCMASAFEDIRNQFYGHKKSLEECFKFAFRNFTVNWGDFPTQEREYKDFVNCWSVVEAYFKEYPPETDYFQPLMQATGMPAVEFKFAIPMEVRHPVTEEPILYSGRIDMLSEPADQHGMVWPVDEKTTKALGPSWQKQWDMRGQFYGYAYALNHLGYTCPGALVRGMAIQQTQFAFQEKPVFYSPFHLNRWWRMANAKVREIVSYWRLAQMKLEDEGTDAMHEVIPRAYGDACNSFGTCTFTELCTNPHPQSIYINWETRVWNPLAKDPTADSEDRLKSMGKVSLQSAMEGME